MRLTIGKRLFLGFLLLLLLEIGIVGLGVVNIHRLSLLNQQSLGLIVPMERVYGLFLGFGKLIMPTNGYLSYGNIVEKEVFKLNAEQVEKDIARLKKVFPEGFLPEFIQTAEESFQNLKEMAEKIFQLEKPIGNIEGMMLMLEMGASLEKATLALEEYHGKYLKRRLDVLKEQGAQIVKESMIFFLSFSFLGLALSLILNYLLARRIRNPIVTLEAACKRLASGYMDEKIKINTQDELEELASVFNQMAQDIREREDKIKQANEELAKWGRHLEERVEERTKELRHAAEEWRFTFDSISDGILINDAEYNITKVNKTLCKLLGVPPEELVGRKCYRILHNMEEPIEVCPFKKSLLSKKSEFVEVFEPHLNSWFSITASPIFDEQGKIRGAIHQVSDITERKKIEESSRLAELGKLVSSMAHEVNNPLMIISGNAQLCLMEEIQSDTVKNNLKIIVEESKRAKDIIQRLLKFSRPSKGETKEVDINKSIETVVNIVEHQFKLVNVEIKRNYLETPPLISVDEQQIEEVFMNLINNAVEAMPDGGVITITTSLEGDFLRLDFKDTGSGMSEETKKKLFEPFFTTKEKGTGLGLSVCYGIIEAHNGEIKFESELNKGTTVTVLLLLGGVKRNA